MKKFYILTMALAAALSASALEFNFGKPLNTNIKLAGSTLEMNHHANRLPAFNAPAKAPAANMDELCGKYEIYFVDYAEDQACNYSTYADVIDLGDNTIGIANFYGVEDPIKANVDFAEGTVSINDQIYSKLSNDGVQYYDISARHYHWSADWETIEPVEGPMVGKIKDGVIEFDRFDVLVITADINGRVVYELNALDSFRMEVFKDPCAPYAPWKLLDGKATFADGWVLPGINADFAKTTYEVEIEQSTVNPGVFRLVNPYSNDLFNSHNVCADEGYIMFDTSLPSCVVVLPYVASDFADPKAGKFYCLNWAGICKDQYGYTNNADIKAHLDVNSVPCATRDGLLVTIPECVFGTTAKKVDIYSFDLAGEGYTSTIMLPKSAEGGIGDISIDEANAPVEYFNLQGQKVDNPAAGLYIRRQGNKAIKVIVK